MFSTFLVTLFTLAPLVLSQASNNDPTGKTLFLSQPACNSYKCVVQWPQCSAQMVQWLNPPDSNLWATLNSQEGDTSYNISVNVAPHSYCSNITTDMSCGETNFTVGLWTPGKYSVAVASLADPSTVGYSDLIEVVANSSCTTPPASASAAPSSSASVSGSAVARASSVVSGHSGASTSAVSLVDGGNFASASADPSSDTQGSGASKTGLASSLAAAFLAVGALAVASL